VGATQLDQSTYSKAILILTSKSSTVPTVKKNASCSKVKLIHEELSCMKKAVMSRGIGKSHILIIGNGDASQDHGHAAACLLASAQISSSSASIGTR
jgi:hypothetical protein